MATSFEAQAPGSLWREPAAELGLPDAALGAELPIEAFAAAPAMPGPDGQTSGKIILPARP